MLQPTASTREDSAGENADFRAFSLARPSPAPTAPRPSSRNAAGGPGRDPAQRAATSPHHAPRSFRAGLLQHFEFGGLNHHLMYRPTALADLGRFHCPVSCEQRFMVGHRRCRGTAVEGLQAYTAGWSPPYRRLAARACARASHCIIGILWRERAAHAERRLGFLYGGLTVRL